MVAACEVPQINVDPIGGSITHPSNNLLKADTCYAGGVQGDDG